MLSVRRVAQTSATFTPGIVAYSSKEPRNEITQSEARTLSSFDVILEVQ